MNNIIVYIFKVAFKSDCHKIEITDASSFYNVLVAFLLIDGNG